MNYVLEINKLNFLYNIYKDMFQYSMFKYFLNLLHYH
jgi:hypothetical protein